MVIGNSIYPSSAFRSAEVERVTAALFLGGGNIWHKAPDILPSDYSAQSSILSTSGRASMQYEPVCLLPTKRSSQCLPSPQKTVSTVDESLNVLINS